MLIFFFFCDLWQWIKVKGNVKGLRLNDQQLLKPNQLTGHFGFKRGNRWRRYYKESATGLELCVMLRIAVSSLPRSSEEVISLEMLFLIDGSIDQSMWAELSGENSRSPLTWVFAPPLHRSKSQQTAPLNSAPRSPTISSRSGEIAPRSLTFKIPLYA